MATKTKEQIDAERLTITYGDYSIRYDESREKWAISLGAEKDLALRDTLAQAKTYCESRDERANKEKKPRFQRIQAFYRRWSSSDFEEVTVTSFAEAVSSYGGEQAWVTD